MRELPEPDHTESVQMSEGGQDWVRHVDLFTSDQVLAIQKQAYEDGLRDAIPDVDALAQHIRWANGGNKCGAGSLAEKIVEFLTASQKDMK